MQRPVLSNCVDAVMSVREWSVSEYLRQLRTEVLPAIRSLEAEGAIVWYSFLIHDRTSAGREDLAIGFPQPFLHFRFSLPNGADRGVFMSRIPRPFLHPVAGELGPVGGIDLAAMRGDWADAWWMIGESSDWVLKLAEAHSDHNPIPLTQLIQFLHFITNGLCIGNQSIFIPGGVQQF